MGDSTCIMQTFSSETHHDTKEGSPMCALGESISFGRYMTEPLNWERWSSFNSNRHLEEVEKYSRPGSVAQKKAYFEAHYKAIAERKAAAAAAAAEEEAVSLAASNDVLELEEQSIGMSSGGDMDLELDGLCNDVVVDEVEVFNADEVECDIDANVCNSNYESCGFETSKGEEVEPVIKEEILVEDRKQIQSPNRHEDVNNESIGAEICIVKLIDKSALEESIPAMLEPSKSATNGKPGASPLSSKALKNTSSDARPSTPVSSQRPSTSAYSRRPSTPVQRPRPITPVQHLRPSTPVQRPRPIAPVQHLRPSTPVQPRRPSTPVQSRKPSIPVQPVRPSTPVQRPRPSTPVHRPRPIAPVQHLRPSTPVQRPRPIAHVQHLRPSTPVQPHRPSTPVQSRKPSIPVQPVRPSTPVQRPRPSTPVKRPALGQPMRPNAPVQPRRPSTPVQPQRENNATPNNKNSARDAMDKKISTPKSLHMSINFTPSPSRAGEISKLSSPIVYKNRDSRVASIPNNTSKDSSTPLRPPSRASASVNGVPKPRPVTPQSGSKRPQMPPLGNIATSSRKLDVNCQSIKSKAPLGNKAPAIRKLDVKCQSLTIESKTPIVLANTKADVKCQSLCIEHPSCSSSSSSSRNKAWSPAASSSFNFRTDERAAKRKEYFQRLEEKFNAKEAQKMQLEAKSKEKDDNEVRKLQQSLGFKAKPKPMPNFSTRQDQQRVLRTWNFGA